jgi:starvation-inducible outer membrane lipoprotein
MLIREDSTTPVEKTCTPNAKGGARALALTALLSFTFLAGCSTPVQLPEQAAAPHYAFLDTIQITTADTTAEIEQRYGGKIVAWQPESGFAVIGLNRSLQALDTTSTTVQPNTRIVTIAEGRYLAWAGGRYLAWAGGQQMNTFIDSVFTWNSGWFGYSTDTAYPTVSINNLYAFTGGNVIFGAGKTGIRLSQAQALTPKLGAGVKVAVIDTGVDLSHPGLRGVPGNSTQPNHLAPPSDWQDYVGGDSIPQEETDASPNATNEGYGHGTGVAGVVLQIAPNAVIMPIRVLGADGSGDATSVVSAIEWAVNHGAKVINLSLGTITPVDAIRTMVAWATAKGVFVIASAGNTDDTNVTYPAADAGVALYGGNRLVSVGSVGSGNYVGNFLAGTTAIAAAFDRKSSLSSYGPKVKIYAPGEAISTLLPNAQTGNWSGTSFAAPVVSGTLALALGQSLTTKQLTRVPNALTATSSSIATCNPLIASQLGGGRVNTEAFIATVLGKNVSSGTACP